MPPPLRFLALVLGGWVCVRTALLVPPPSRAGPDETIPRGRASASLPTPSAVRKPPAGRAAPVHRPARSMAALRVAAVPPRDPEALAPPPAPTTALAPAAPADLLAAPAPPTGGATRWSASAWVLLRAERGGGALAPGGTLGGSQAGARLRYRLGGGLALSARLSAPLRRPAGAEAAVGLEWRPLPGVPAHILLERRQAIGREGRSAFAVTLHGGGSRALPGGLRLDVHGQAGIVGLRSRDGFVDGAARLSGGRGRLELGAGAWGAAQPGAARLDAGPSLSYRLPAARGGIRLSADWRFRVAGTAAPGAGPALTLAADF